MKYEVKSEMFRLPASYFILRTSYFVILMLAFTACGKTVSEASDDSTITARVKTALLNDPQIGALKIDVDTANGIVTLSGTVASQAEAARVLELARRAAGAHDVKSTLQVTPPTPQS